MESNQHNQVANSIRPTTPTSAVTSINGPVPGAVTVPTTPEQTQRIKRSESMLRMDQVEKRLGQKKSAIYAMIKRGEFPAPIRISARCVAWPESWIDTYIDNLINTATSASQKPAQRPQLPSVDTTAGGVA